MDLEFTSIFYLYMPDLENLSILVSCASRDILQFETLGLDIATGYSKHLNISSI